MTWFCDFEAFKSNQSQYYTKEIAILNNDGKQCYNYHIAYPCCMVFTPADLRTAYFQYRRHGLAWEFGDFNFLDAIAEIKSKVGFDTIYVKGLEKATFLKQFLRNVKCMAEQPSLNSLNNCLNEVCELNHGKWCARRKAYELYYLSNFYCV